MNDATASDAPRGDRVSHSPDDLTAPLPDGGTLDHVATPATGTVDFPADQRAAAPGGTLDYPHGTGDGTEVLPGGTIDHVPAAGEATEAIDGGTLDHAPSSGDGTDHIENDGGHTVDPAQGKWLGGPEASKTAPPVRRKDALPKTVAGYEILGVLGRGAMGVVYKARQRGLNRLVALKMILSGAHASEHELGRFRTEAEAVARIQHPNIVQIYEVGEEDGRPYFSLEYVEGGTLSRKIQGKPQPPAEAARLVQALAAGMDCAHRANVIHRDLKPANVLLAADGTPKITDFGLAKRLEEDAGQTHTGAILGTPSYMSPEQADGRTDEIGPLADVWSLGAILYELLTGRVPFQAPTVLETIIQVRTREPVAPPELQPGIPRDLETICLKCLQKDRGKRYASAGDLAEDLRRFLNNEPILARPVGLVERGWRWCKRNPKLAVMSGVIAAAMIGWAMSMSAAAVFLKRERDRADENAALATLKKEEAEKSESLAKANESKAIKNEKRANDEAITAKRQHSNVLKLFTEFGEACQRRLNAKRFMQMGSDVRLLRDDMLRVLRQGIRAMARDIEESGAGSFGTAASYWSVGDLLKRVGQGEEAVKQFQLALAAAEKDVQEKPDSDKARANFAIALLNLAHMDLDYFGEAQKARDVYEKARKMRQEIADHPRSREYNDRENMINLSHYELSLGRTEMVLGAPETALGHFRKLVELRKAWAEGRPDIPEGHNLLGQAYQWLGIGLLHTGDEAGSRDAFGKAVGTMEALIKKHPKAFWYKADLAEILGDRGDMELRAGKPAEAEKTYQESLNYLKAGLASVPDHAPYQLQLAHHHERVAVIATRKGNKAAAKKDYEEALQIRKELREIDPNNVIWQGTALRLVAHTGRVPLAVRQLEMLYRKRPRSIPLLLDAARACAVGVATAGDAATKQRYVERAIGALHAAVRAGYKDSFALKTDPDLAALRQEPLFVSLLARMGGPG